MIDVVVADSSVPCRDGDRGPLIKTRHVAHFQTHLFLSLSVMTRLSRHSVVAPSLAAPLLTDTLRSVVGSGTREDFAALPGGCSRSHAAWGAHTGKANFRNFVSQQSAYKVLNILMGTSSSALRDGGLQVTHATLAGMPAQFSSSQVTHATLAGMPAQFSSSQVTHATLAGMPARFSSSSVPSRMPARVLWIHRPSTWYLSCTFFQMVSSWHLALVCLAPLSARAWWAVRRRGSGVPGHM